MLIFFIFLAVGFLFSLAMYAIFAHFSLPDPDETAMKETMRKYEHHEEEICKKKYLTAINGK
jgi:hypothetical protein